MKGGSGFVTPCLTYSVMGATFRHSSAGAVFLNMLITNMLCV